MASSTDCEVSSPVTPDGVLLVSNSITTFVVESVFGTPGIGTTALTINGATIILCLAFGRRLGDFFLH